MDYDAITVDTSIFEKYGLVLNKGLLDKLSQFGDGPAQFVLSEIVLRELTSHLISKSSETKNALGGVITRLRNFNLLSTDQLEIIRAIDTSLVELEELSNSTVKKFCNKCGVEVILAEETDIKQLVQSYFTSSPPFEKDGKKKAEFPDAIALLSLENWADQNDKKILAITNDNDWHRYAESSRRIDADKDLASALAKFQEHTEEAEQFIATLIQDTDDTIGLEFYQQVSSSLETEIDRLNIYAEASSSYIFEEEYPYISLVEYSLQEDNIQVIQTARDFIVVRIGVQVEAKAHCDFSFSVKDGIDKDYVSIGSSSVETEVDFEASLLITIAGDISGNTNEIALDEIELVDAIDWVDFGEIEPDFGDDYYY